VRRIGNCESHGLLFTYRSKPAGIPEKVRVGVTPRGGSKAQREGGDGTRGLMDVTEHVFPLRDHRVVAEKPRICTEDLCAEELVEGMVLSNFDHCRHIGLWNPPTERDRETEERVDAEMR
jgi:hypothetical protein